MNYLTTVNTEKNFIDFQLIKTYLEYRHTGDYSLQDASDFYGSHGCFATKILIDRDRDEFIKEFEKYLNIDLNEIDCTE